MRGWHVDCSLSGMQSGTNKIIDDAKRLAADGDYAAAATVFQGIFDSQSAGPDALVALADVMDSVGQVESSLALLADSVDESNPNQATLVRIADQLRSVGRFGEAADFLLVASSCYPEDADLRAKTEASLSALGRSAQLEWVRSGFQGDVPPV
jgi:thioredoxin-like negative regulator of GroEL